MILGDVYHTTKLKENSILTIVCSLSIALYLIVAIDFQQIIKRKLEIVQKLETFLDEKQKINK